MRRTSSSPSGPMDTSGKMGGPLQQARLIWLLWKDSRVSSWLKLIPVAGLVYLLSPIDLIPDLMLPGLGELDDLAIILLSLKTFVELAPPGIVRELLQKLSGSRLGPAATPGNDTEPFIDVPYRVIDETEN